MANRSLPHPLSLNAVFGFLQSAAIMLVCSPVFAQTAPLSQQPVADASTNTASPLLDLFQIFILLVVVGVVGYSIWFAREKLSAIRQKEALDEATLAAEISRLENQAGISGGAEITMLNASALQALDDMEEQWREDESPPLSQLSNESPSIPAAKNSREGCDLIIERLRAGGFVDEVEEYRELNGDPSASAVIKLRSGKRVLVVGYYESEVFLHRNLLRYDMVIMQGRDGKALAVSRFENVLSDWLAGKFL